MKQKDIKFKLVIKPNLSDLREFKGQHFLKVVFEYKGKKFVLEYEQRHYFYRGMPGSTSGFYKLSVLIGEGEYKELININDGQGEFQIPIPQYAPNGRKYTTDAYGDGEDYRGEVMCNITNQEIYKLLIKPYFEMYYE